ncbi:ThiF family adenylyltransferase [Clavibacter michiganensis]|uniref:ThiF family adenylyltransferase n=1 Tax=Clavibacter michiganensis TaxID=28447 RepID=UPI0026DB050F|nr:ThiF family adenylyltransferase [Clavibacter michiganensis]MDO4144212.1 ThiF family adenylyltransferase [Clavibacter michiganensis]
MTEEHWHALQAHLFPGDGDEHGAVLRCGIATSSRGNRLLVRDVIPAVDGKDYIPGDRGYRKLTAAFAAENIDVCAEEQLAYLAVHNHGGTTRVGFSDTDMASHERGYPALLGINNGPPVGALVFAEKAVAGDIWTADGRRHEITHLRVAGRPQLNFTSEPTLIATADPTYDRQARIFGDRGQAILATSRVVVVGVGGAGSLVSEYLARLGVGEIIVIDPDRLDASNLPRVVGARRRDLPATLLPTWAPRWVTNAAARWSTPKVSIAARVAREASPASRITTIHRSALEPDVAKVLTDCDHIFLAADSALVRRLVNSITHQYLVPHTQIGSKVSTSNGHVSDIFSVSRMSSPGSGCLRCNGLIPASRLTEEATSEVQRRRQRYVDDSEVHAPSVITLNAVAASRAVDDWLMTVGGLTTSGVSPNHWVSYNPLTDEVVEFEPVVEPGCPHCGRSRFARGDAVALLAQLAPAQ